MALKAWFDRNRRRILVDMHIPDWDPAFLSELSPERYVEMMVAGGANAVMVYANSHVGLCYWPTRTGQLHRGLKGMDFFGRVLELCRQRDIAFVAYYSLIYNNWAYINHPGWRIVPREVPVSGRYGLCCPNSPGYRDFALAQIEELFSTYACDGVFFDMTFWPAVCYCPHCVARYRQEKGSEPPYRLDWSSPRWIAFQGWRRECIDEFAQIMTEQVRHVRPEMSVTHQFSTVLHGWRYGVPFSLAEHCDYLSGDFYGPAIQQSIVCKAFYSLSKKRAFEFHTSRCVDLRDHVTLKSRNRLRTQAFLAPAHNAAFMFIDAIDPVGTLQEPVYGLLGSVFEEVAPYEPLRGAELCADVGVYFSEESKFDPDGDSAAPPDQQNMPHWQALQGACKALQEAHLPFGIVTKKNLHDLDGYQVLILPDVLLMDQEEARAVRGFVNRGGSLYASGRSLSRLKSGEWPADFLLADLLGASRMEERNERLSFFSPANETCRQWFDPQEHLIHSGPVQRVAAAGAQVWATLTLPCTDPLSGDIFGNSFASIHSNPPGSVGTEPALLMNAYGAGKICYAAGALEASEHEINKHVLARIIRHLLSGPTWFEADAHPCVEVVVLIQDENRRIGPSQPLRRGRLLISLLNYQEQAPNVPVDGTYRVRVPAGQEPRRLLSLPGKEEVRFRRSREGFAEFEVKGLELFAQFLLEFG